VSAARQITEITQLNCKQDMSRWTRAHADAPGINWSVYPGPGGTMIVVEHEEDRSTFLAAQTAQTPQVVQPPQGAQAVPAEPTAMTAFAGTATAAPASFLDFALV
jgi:hypothetical protein